MRRRPVWADPHRDRHRSVDPYVEGLAADSGVEGRGTRAAQTARPFSHFLPSMPRRARRTAGFRLASSRCPPSTSRHSTTTRTCLPRQCLAPTRPPHPVGGFSRSSDSPVEGKRPAPRRQRKERVGDPRRHMTGARAARERSTSVRGGVPADWIGTPSAGDAPGAAARAGHPARRNASSACPSTGRTESWSAPTTCSRLFRATGHRRWRHARPP